MSDEPGLFGVEGRVACVTGASSGLVGRRAATVPAAAGARVVGVARRAVEPDAWRAETVGDAACVTADLADRAALRKAAEAAKAPFSAPEILVDAAEIDTCEAADEAGPEGRDRALALNPSAPLLLARTLVPGVREKGFGRIVDFGSLQSRSTFAGGIACGASKGCVERMTRAMAEAWSRGGITANAAAPGFFPTQLTRPVFEDAERNCIRRNGAPDDLDGPPLFLGSRASARAAGRMLFVDGGYAA